jgi:hypothetical protein
MNKNRFILHLLNVKPDHAVSEKTVGFDQVIKEKNLSFFRDYALKKWPLRGSLRAKTQVANA